jgi:hypothetical protein
MSDRGYGCVIAVLLSAVLWFAIYRAFEWLLSE